MGLWAIKYADEHDKWWVDVVLQDAPPPVSREKVGGRVVTEGFAEVTGLVIARRTPRSRRRREPAPSHRPGLAAVRASAPDALRGYRADCRLSHRGAGQARARGHPVRERRLPDQGPAGRADAPRPAPR